MELHITKISATSALAHRRDTHLADFPLLYILIIDEPVHFSCFLLSDIFKHSFSFLALYILPNKSPPLPQADMSVMLCSFCFKVNFFTHSIPRGRKNLFPLVKLERSLFNQVPSFEIVKNLLCHLFYPFSFRT